MAISHNQAVVTYYGLTLAGSTTVNCNELADGGVITNDGISLLALKLQVLWVATYDCTRVDMAVLANTHTSVDGDIAINNCTLTYLHISVNASERTYGNRRMKLCFWMNIIHILSKKYNFIFVVNITLGVR